MGQIIRFPIQLSEYPNAVHDLDPTEHLLLLAIRYWVTNYQRGNDQILHLHDAMTAAGAPDAAVLIDRFMAVAARAAKRPIDIQCPHCPHVSGDEKHLIYAASLAQAGNGHLAEGALCNALLSRYGAEFAFGPLEDLGMMFRAAGLRFRQRHPPPDDIERGNVIEPWSPAESDQGNY